MNKKNVREQEKNYNSPTMEIKVFDVKDLIVMSGESSTPIDVDVIWNSEWNNK